MRQLQQVPIQKAVAKALLQASTVLDRSRFWPRRSKGIVPRQVVFGVWAVAFAGFIEGQQAVPHSGDDHGFVARQPALELTTRQLCKRYLLPIRPDEEGRTSPEGFVRQSSTC